MTEQEATYVVQIAQAMAQLTPEEQRHAAMLVYAYISGLKEAKKEEKT